MQIQLYLHALLKGSQFDKITLQSLYSTHIQTNVEQ